MRVVIVCFFFSSRRRHTRLQGDWSSDVCSSDLAIALPALADDRVWLVDARYGASGRQRYVLVEVGLADGRVHTRWTLPYQTAPIAVLPSGLLARGLQDDLEVVEPG